MSPLHSFEGHGTLTTVKGDPEGCACRSTGVPPQLEVRRLRKRFGSLQALDDVSLTVPTGSLVAVVGDNGAGKSTLAKCIAGAVRPDAGEVSMRGRPLTPHREDPRRAGIGVVWQDLSLCENLDTVANLFLGREHRRVFLTRIQMQRDAQLLLERVGIHIPDVTRPVASLSGGQRQVIAVARAVAGNPDLLLLDEPTAALGVAETRMVLDLLRELRSQGTAMLLITHQLEHVFDLADRVVVLRQGKLVADVSPREVHPDDLVALQSGIEVDSTASRQLHRLSSLVEQLSEVEPTASLPLVVSAMTAALGQEQLCLHLLNGDADPPVLHQSAAIALPDPLRAALEELPLGTRGGPVGLAAATAGMVVTEDVRSDRRWNRFRRAAEESGIRSCWAAPIIGSYGVLGTISGYGETAGQPRHDQLELIALYARHAASAIEHERVLRLEVAEREARALRRSQQMQRDFLSRLNHELRTPLTAIHGYADTLRQPDVHWPEDSQRQFLDTIAAESDRMRRLVTDLLDASAIEAGIFAIRPDWCDLRLVLEASAACAAPQPGRSVTIEVDATVGPVWADHDRLEQIFVNLLENAVRHTPSDRQVRVRAAPAPDGRQVHIRVQDDGPGIPAEVVERLFTSPVNGRRPPDPGGLGLLIVRGIAHAHNGKLSVEPVPRGASILVSLPAGRADG